MIGYGWRFRDGDVVIAKAHKVRDIAKAIPYLREETEVDRLNAYGEWVPTYTIKDVRDMLYAVRMVYFPYTTERQIDLDQRLDVLTLFDLWKDCVRLKQLRSRDLWLKRHSSRTHLLRRYGFTLKKTAI